MNGTRAGTQNGPNHAEYSAIVDGQAGFAPRTGVVMHHAKRSLIGCFGLLYLLLTCMGPLLVQILYLCGNSVKKSVGLKAAL